MQATGTCLHMCAKQWPHRVHYPLPSAQESIYDYQSTAFEFMFTKLFTDKSGLNVSNGPHMCVQKVTGILLHTFKSFSELPYMYYLLTVLWGYSASFG